MSEFEAEFADWLRGALAAPVPNDVRAFCFNLFEPADLPEKFGVDLIGAPTFDPDNEDWASDEIWCPNPRWVAIPTEWSSDEWSQSLARVCVLVRALIDNKGATLAALTSRDAVAVGFVGGDLEIVWTRERDDAQGRGT